MEQKTNLFKRIIGTAWQTINTLRKLTINLFFFLFLAVFIAALSNEEETIIVPDASALVLNLKGDIVEQKVDIDPMDAFLTEALNQKEDKPEILMSDVLAVIEKAKNDGRITMLVLQLNQMNNIGLSKLQDIAAAIIDFKQSDKIVVAIGNQYSQAQYYLASHADKVWLDPKGSLLLDGFSRYQLYFKSALNKLAITQHVFRVGTYKSAVEPYLRNNMSPEAKEANKQWLSDLWLAYKQDVAAQRDFPINNFDDDLPVLIAKFKKSNNSFAQYALDNKWVDELKTFEQMERALAEFVGKDELDEHYNNIDFKDYLTALNTELVPVTHTLGKVAVIVAKGVILDGIQPPGTIGGESTAELLQQARKNKEVKAVVLRVDSPGGSAYASEVIRREIDLLKASGKPVVASMGTYAASGGYWISAPADIIYASPTTITGSIGIFGLMMTVEKTLKNIGINTDGVGTTDISGIGITRPLSTGVQHLFQLNVEQGYQDFISLVSKNREMTLAQVDAVAQGRVWSGIKAKELGLVDELGDLNAAIKAAADLAKLETFDTLIIEKESSTKDKLLQNLFGNVTLLLPDARSQVTPSAISQVMAQINSALSGELALLNQFNDPQHTYVFCEDCKID